MTTRTVYKVKNLTTGEYMDKGGRFNKKGKTWETIGQLKLTLGQAGWWSHSASHNNINIAGELPGTDVKIIEIKIVETEDNMSDLDEIVIQQRRYILLGQKFGESFKDLVSRIEAQGQNDQFQWVMIVQSKYNWTTKQLGGDIAELFDVIKSMKLVQNKDYKKATSYGSSQAAVAFTSKELAMRVRLACRVPVIGVDIVKYVETNLDATDKDALNNST